ncbi:TetR family transcriptional regulator [Leucobacter luti]|uniref:TetR family transcriptional regulator n=1 Tax=Leucobacter luti TaxID=340320 RepID=A0A4R6RTH9_9MICO|nr:hypothetical protein [Leucobacter luti]TDP89316.1 TetR family transcriptional regulator [Leucobacter luti]
MVDDAPHSAPAARRRADPALPPSDPRSAAVHAKLYAAAERLGAGGLTCSVSSLTREAGVSRSVFYVHFADLPDFALHLQQSRIHEIAEAAAIERGTNPLHAMLQAHHRLVAHFSANRALYLAALALGGGAAAAHSTATAVRAALLDHMATLTPPPGIHPQFVANYLAHAVTGTLTDWLQAPGDLTDDALAQQLFAMLPTWLYRDPETAVGSPDGV